MQKKVLIIQDISCFGSCSMNVANSILNSFGFETCTLPSAIFSTHTGFLQYKVCDFTDKMNDFVDHYIQENIKFDCILIGYIYNINQGKIIEKAINNLLTKDGIVILDPAMADYGKLYKGLGMEHVEMMQSLLKYATFVIPNITEAELLTKTCDDYNLTAKKIIDSGAKNVIITSIDLKNVIANYYYSADKVEMFGQEKIDKSYHGVGDLFTAIFTANYLLTNNVRSSIALAQEFICEAILLTKDSLNHDYGVVFEPLIHKYSKKIQ